MQAMLMCRRILGDAPLSVVCFDSNSPSVNILHIGDEMSKRGWSLNSLQNPASIHLCVTLVHTRDGGARQFLADLRSSVESVKSSPSDQYKDGMSAIYGLAGTVPASMVGSGGAGWL